MSKLNKMDEKYKEFSQIQVNLYEAEKLVKGQFSEKAITDFSKERFDNGQDKKARKQLDLSFYIDQMKTDEEDMRYYLLLGIMCFISFCITAVTYSYLNKEGIK